MTYYIDPGTTKGCAVAHFSWHALTGLCFWSAEKGVTKQWGVFGPPGALWEKPQLYPYAGKSSLARQTAQANDLIDLAAAGAACAQFFGGQPAPPVRSVKPREWKKQASKPAHHLQVLKTLQPSELQILTDAWGKPYTDLIQYITDASLLVAMRKPGSYGAQITDLLDAIALGLWDTKRLVL